MTKLIAALAAFALATPAFADHHEGHDTVKKDGKMVEKTVKDDHHGDDHHDGDHH